MGTTNSPKLQWFRAESKGSVNPLMGAHCQL
uniref:Uncharacterized protein n=1 Tax=Trichinella nativa TaxID=6335 RepID=A0A0V1IL62_9BILA